MPKEITHCILAERAAHTMAASQNKFKRQLGRDIYFRYEKHPELLTFGSIAPDIFFYDIKMPWEFRVKHRGLVWGELIHGTHGEDSLAHVMQMFSILNSGELQSHLMQGRPFSDDEREGLSLFVAGYLSHVALDTVMHPIVYHYAGDYYAKDKREKLRAEAKHRAIETVLDLANLEAIGTDLKRYRAPKKMALTGKWRDLVLKFYVMAILRAWPELAQREFGVREDADVANHPLFRVALRGYKKQLRFNRLFQTLALARSGLWYNRRKKDALHFNSSLLYPAGSYAEYKRLSMGKKFEIEDIRSFRHPLTNHELPVRRAALVKRILARSHAFMRTAELYLHNRISEDAARRTLRGYSLNHGKVNLATSAMQFFAPLQIDGNFSYTGVKPA